MSGAAGGASGQQNTGGYGTYNVNNPSSRVLKPPGGGSSNIFGGPVTQTSITGSTVGRPQQQRGAAGGSAAQQNKGGYGTYNINSPSSRVLAPPGGGSSGIFGGQQAGAQPQARSGVKRGNHQASGSAGGSAANKNTGGYGTYSVTGKSSSRVLAPPGGGSSNIFGGPVTQTSISGSKGVGRPQQRGGAAGGSSAQTNMGGYGTYDINSPSSRVLAPPGGKTSNIFGGPVKQTSISGSKGVARPQQQQQQQRPPQQQQQQRPQGGAATRGGAQVAGGSGGQKNMGGYGTYDINQPSSRVLAPPGGKSNNIFGGPVQQTSISGSRGVGQAKRAGGAAGSGGSQKNMGGYGTYDINQPSSRVLAPPGGGSSISFG